LAIQLIKSEALLLRRFLHGDTSLVIHLFTRDKGRVPFIAKGARSGGRKAPVPLVPVVLLEAIWRSSTKSELQLLREWSLVDGFGEIHKDFEKLAWAQAAIEVLGRSIINEDVHEELFDETINYLKTLETANGKYENLLHRFRLITLKEIGYEINLIVPENAGQNMRFRPDQGKIVQGNHGLPVSLGAWKSLGLLAKSEYDSVKSLRLSRDISKEINAILDVAFQYSLEKWKPLESLKLLEPLGVKGHNV
jgi:DNA repair protein RecO